MTFLRNLDHWRTQGFGRMRCWLEFKFSGSSVPQARRSSGNLELTFRVVALRRMSPRSAGGSFSANENRMGLLCFPQGQGWSFY